MKKISIILSVIISSVIFSNSINTVNEKIEISQTVDQISYKANKIGVAYGYLRKSTSENISKKKFSVTDIVIIDKLENDKFPYFVSALIVGKDMRKEDIKLDTKIPMMTYKDAYVSKDFSRLVGKFVRIEIGRDTFTIKKATKKEAREYYGNK
jgi:hypothetical protein